MKITERLYSEVEGLWKTASQKEFLIKMADGTMDGERYKWYMLQDYYYLLDYKKILERLLALSNDSDLDGFLKIAVDVTLFEIDNVHLPAMKKLGITEEEIKTVGKNSVIAGYIDFYNETIDKNGLLGGFTALLQCCWNYEYLGKVMCEKYGDLIEKSPYKFWFDAYTSKEYVETSKTWRDLVDKKTVGVNEQTEEALLKIFKTCAEFENKFWDAL